MIDLHFWTTPNGYKVLIFLEEIRLPYSVKSVNISQNEQFNSEFLKISPNNRIPAIVDNAPSDTGEPVTVFESGAILWYLAEKSGRFIPSSLRGQQIVMECLMWQMGGLGPMRSQNHRFAPERIPYAFQRYVTETEHLYGILETRLDGRDYIAGEYGIVDMACHPWCTIWEGQGIRNEEYPNVKRCLDVVGGRGAVQRAYSIGKAVNTAPTVTSESKSVLFGQGRR